MSLLPSKPDTSAPDDADPRVVGVESDDADDLLAALSSDTARRVLAELHEEPAPPAELSDRVDTSLQNVQYHLENLESAGAVQVVDTAYSEKGREMDVYAPADQPLVIFAGDQNSTSSIRTALSRLLGGFGILALASLAVQGLAGRGSVLPFPGGSADGGDGGAFGAVGTPEPTNEVAAARTATPTPQATAAGGDAAATGASTAGPTATPAAEATPTPAAAEADTVARGATQTEAYDLATGTADAAAQSGVDAAVATLPPGMLFFLGGATVLVAGFVYWYASAKRPE